MEANAAGQLIRPPALQAGDRIATVTLSWGGPGCFPHRYAAGKQQLEAAFGVTVVEMPHTLAPEAWVADNPAARAADLMQAFADPSINGIVSTIGGSESIRLLPYIDLDVIRANPKPFLGYSDTTISHMACYRAGLTSFYGPSIMSGFGENGGLHDYLVEGVRRTLFETEPAGLIPPNTNGWTVEKMDWSQPAFQSKKRQLTPSTGWRVLQKGRLGRGRLLGGCIEVFDWLRGTDFWPTLTEWQDAILFIETSEDAPSADDVGFFLRAFAAVGAIERISGVMFARPGGQLPVTAFDAYDDILRRVIVEECGRSEIPIFTRMDFGHTDPMWTFPYGVLAEMDGETGRLTLLESGVTPRATK